MNTLNSRYANHVKDTYGISDKEIPTIQYQELSDLITIVRNESQVLWIHEAVEKIRKELLYKRNKSKEYVLLHGQMTVLRYEEKNNSYYESKRKDIVPLARDLSTLLELDEGVTIEIDGRVDTRNLRKMMKTSNWLMRNLGY